MKKPQKHSVFKDMNNELLQNHQKEKQSVALPLGRRREMRSRSTDTDEGLKTVCDFTTDSGEVIQSEQFHNRAAGECSRGGRTQEEMKTLIENTVFFEVSKLDGPDFRLKI